MPVPPRRCHATAALCVDVCFPLPRGMQVLQLQIRYPFDWDQERGYSAANLKGVDCSASRPLPLNGEWTSRRATLDDMA
jgi:hypothetical protein